VKNGASMQRGALLNTTGPPNVAHHARWGAA